MVGGITRKPCRRWWPCKKKGLYRKGRARTPGQLFCLRLPFLQDVTTHHHPNKEIVGHPTLWLTCSGSRGDFEFFFRGRPKLACADRVDQKRYWNALLLLG